MPGPPGAAAGPPAPAPPRLAALPRRLAAAPRGERARLVDDALGELATAAGLPAAGAALVAVGGYGRGELSPHSDLDLMLLHAADGPGADVAALAERLWYPIWDAGLALDHSVRSVETAAAVARSDLPALLGMLDLRHVAGDPALTFELTRRVRADWRAGARRRLPELREQCQARARRFGDLAFATVPDLKESKGGLRDLQVLRAVAASWVADCPHTGLAAAKAELLEIRDALRRLTGRATDRLQQQDQDELAARLGLPGRDALLRRVAGIGRLVAHTTDLTWYRVDRQLVATAAGHRRMPLADGVVAQDGEAGLARGVDPADPTLTLRLAAAAARAGLPVSPAALTRVRRAAPPLPVPWPAAARRAFGSLLGAGPPLLAAWEALDQAGAISALLPGWERLRSLPQHDPVHRHTVDRHLVETAVQAGALLRTVARPDLLLLGALLHDIGKGTGGDHAAAGAELAPGWLGRIGVPAADAAEVTWLVRHHLLLAQTATRRDLADPATVTRVARLAQTPDRLDLLVALTQADAVATGPRAWSPWKAAQVRELADRVRAALAGTAGDAGRPAPESPPEAAKPSEVDVTRGDTGIEISVSSPDRRGLLAVVAGVIELHRLTVRSATVTTVGEQARSTFLAERTFGQDPDVAALRADLARAAAGRLDPRAELARRRGTAGPGGGGCSADGPAAPDVRIAPNAAQLSTVLEVRASDAPGLLSAVAGAVAAAGFDVVAARADTYGGDVVDVLYLRTDAGRLTAAEQRAVVAAVGAALPAGGPGRSATIGG